MARVRQPRGAGAGNGGASLTTLGKFRRGLMRGTFSTDIKYLPHARRVRLRLEAANSSTTFSALEGPSRTSFSPNQNFPDGDWQLQDSPGQSRLSLF